MSSAEEQPTMSECCLSGFVHKGDPQGTVETIHELPVYVAQGDSTKGVVVVISDVFGWGLKNTRLLADTYAKVTGCITYLPDFMFGDSLPEEHVKMLLPDREPTGFARITNTASLAIKVGPWLARHRESVSLKIIKPWFEALYKQNQTRKTMVAGYCWGALYAIKLTQRDEWMMSDGSFREGGLVSAVFAAHPSPALSVPKDIEAIARPISFAFAEKDNMVSLDKVKQIKTIMGKKNGLENEITVYDGMKHGFAIRGDISDEGIKKAMDDATNQAVNWFKKHLE